ncbi:MAG: DUF1573 domain-containing protein [Victivallales bacterium]|nr:DUF1573 domain-containing protein [Victivallales bacterium]
MMRFALMLTGLAWLLAAQDAYDFGVAGNYETAAHTFRLMNGSAAAMKVSSVRSSCSCAVGKVDFQQIPPGGVASVNCKIDLKSLEGTVSKNFWVRLEWEKSAEVGAPKVMPADGEMLLRGTESEIVLRMNGTVRSRMKLSRDEVFFKGLESVEVRLLGYAKNATIRKVEQPEDSIFRYEVSEGRRGLVISPVGALPNGSWVEQWQLLFDDEKVTELPLRVRSLNMGKIACIPEELHWRSGRGKQQVILRSLDRNVDFQVLSATIKPDGAAVKAHRLGRGRWQVVVEGAVSQLSTDCRLVVTTDLPDQEKVVLPVHRE